LLAPRVLAPRVIAPKVLAPRVIAPRVLAPRTLVAPRIDSFLKLNCKLKCVIFELKF